jgi:hypothetical protein
MTVILGAKVVREKKEIFLTVIKNWTGAKSLSVRLLILFLFCILPINSSYAISIDSIYLNVSNLFSNGAIKSTTNLKGGNNKLAVHQIGFNNLETSKEFIAAQTLNVETESDENIDPEVIGKALFYPNPMRQTDGGQIGYRLSKDMDLELHIYDMFANIIFKNIFPSGAEGGRKGYNKLWLNLDTFDQFYLSAGVYFYLLINNGKVLTKGKMAIVP